MRGKKAKAIRKEIYGDYSSKQSARNYNKQLHVITVPVVGRDGKAEEHTVLDDYGRPLLGRTGTVRAIGRRRKYQEAKRNV